MDNMMQMIEPVARQMCRLAYENPDEIVYVPRSWTVLHGELIRQGREQFQGRNVLSQPLWGAPASGMELRFEQIRVPQFWSFIDDPSVSCQRWQCYKKAAWEAILGSYAVKQVLLAGKDVPL